MPRRLGLWPAPVGLAAALIAAVVLVTVPLAPGRSPTGDGSPAPLPALPSGSVVTIPTVLADGSSYSLRYVVDPQWTIGVATADSVSSVVVVSGDQIVARMREVPISDGPLFDAFVMYEDSIYWTETTLREDGTDASSLWAAPLDGDSPRLVVADMGFAQLSGSAYDVIVEDGTISWAAVAGAGEPGTVVRSMPVAFGPVTGRTYPGAWRQIARPWLQSTGGGPTSLLDQDTGAQLTVPGSDVARANCTPDAWCRLTLTSGDEAVRLETVAPDGTDRTRLAGPRTTFATVDAATLGRYELLSETAGLEPGQHRLLIYDMPARRTTLVETGSRSQVAVRDGWAWWLAGDYSAPVWHALHLAAL